jgi:hypothetical protein
MQTNQVITQAPKVGFTVVLVSSCFNGKRTPRFKGYAMTREGAEAIREGLYAKLVGEASNVSYKVLSPRQLSALLKDIQGERKARRAKGAVKAAKTRASRGPNNFICCPTCGAKSKKLFSEMGGLQTRKCQRGHTFEYDKWIADRAFWAPATAPAAISRPVSV